MSTIAVLFTVLASFVSFSKNEHCSMEVVQVLDPVLHGEGPHWDSEKEILYFVDIAGMCVHRYKPSDNKHSKVQLEKPIGFVLPINNSESFIIGHGRDIAKLRWDGFSQTHKISALHTVDTNHPNNRLNDAKADKTGVLWAGTMGEEKKLGEVELDIGSLYRMKSDGHLSAELTPVSISNGIAWSADSSRMFYIDSPTRRIDVFKYSNGTISDRQPFFDFNENKIAGFPDGMTIDSDDNLWVACWGGSQVIQIKGNVVKGELLRRVEMPVALVTSVVFGGHELDELYVTSMQALPTSEHLAKQPMAGSLFKVTCLGVYGTKSNPVQLDIIHK